MRRFLGSREGREEGRGKGRERDGGEEEDRSMVKIKG